MKHSVELVFILLRSTNQLVTHMPSQSLHAGREKRQNPWVASLWWHLLGVHCPCREESSCPMRRIHHNFKLSAVHILAKLPKNNKPLTRSLLPVRNSVSWSVLPAVVVSEMHNEALSSGSYLLIGKSSLVWLWSGSSWSPTSDHEQCAKGSRSEEVLWQGLLSPSMGVVTPLQGEAPLRASDTNSLQFVLQVNPLSK